MKDTEMKFDVPDGRIGCQSILEMLNVSPEEHEKIMKESHIDISGDQPARPAICWWVESNYSGYDECGVCGCEFTSKSSNYCPRCGVKFTDHKRK